MTEKIVSITLDGADYTWNGKCWYNNKTFATPCTIIVAKLNAKLAKQLGIKPRF